MTRASGTGASAAREAQRRAGRERRKRGKEKCCGEQQPIGPGGFAFARGTGAEDEHGKCQRHGEQGRKPAAAPGADHQRAGGRGDGGEAERAGREPRCRGQQQRGRRGEKRAGDRQGEKQRKPEHQPLGEHPRERHRLGGNPAHGILVEGAVGRVGREQAGHGEQARKKRPYPEDGHGRAGKKRGLRAEGEGEDDRDKQEEGGRQQRLARAGGHPGEVAPDEPDEKRKPPHPGSGLAEQGVGGRAEPGRALELRPRARDLGLEGGNPRLELGHRKPVEILGGKQAQRVIRAAGQVVGLHDGSFGRSRPLPQAPDDRALALARGLRGCFQAAAPVEDGMATAAAETERRLPETMTAIDPEGPGGPDVLVPVTRPVPEPGPGEVLIRVHAAGVNRPDILQRLGLYPMPPGTTTIPGLEAAGEVVALGPGVSTLRIGDPVSALLIGGGYAEYAVAPEGQCLPVPPGMRFVEAAGLPETYFTVWSNLFETAGAKPGDSVLVHGGTSGIGVTAVDLCKLFGIDVYVTCGSGQKCAAAELVGATRAIDYNARDFAAEIRELTGGRGVDIVLDMVGGDYVPRNLVCLTEGGRHVSIAFQRGQRAEIDLGLVMRRRLVLTGSMLRPRDVAFKARIAAALREKVWPAFADGRLKARIDKTFPLAEAAAAHRHMEQGRHVGKIVLTVVE